MSKASSTISGHVLDNHQRPIGRVQIWRNGKAIAKADDSGFFTVALDQPERREALTFTAAGFVPNTRVYDGRVGGNGNTIVVWPRASRVAFDASRELDVELGGSRIRLAAGVLVRPDGKPHRGRARLAFTLFDITSPLQRAAASGDFSGRMLDGSEQRLSSFGIFHLAIEDETGQPLGTAPDASAELSIPMPRALAGRAPKEVGLFDLDPTDGRWVETGSFQADPSDPAGFFFGGWVKVPPIGGGTISNLDVPQSTSCVNVQVLHTYHPLLGLPPVPMANMTVTAQSPQSTFTADANGHVCLVVEWNVPFTVTASGSMGASLYTTITPVAFAAPTVSSGAGDCGDEETCPFVGVVPVDLVVGVPPFDTRAPRAA